MTANYTLIRRVTVSSGNNPSSITISNIPQTYDNIKILSNTRSTGGSTYTGINMYINNDTTVSNYKNAYIEGYNNATSGNANTNATVAFYAAGSSADTYVFCAGEVTMANYTSSTSKVYYTNSGYNGNSTTSYPTDLSGFNYSGTSPVTSLVFTPSAGSFATNSTIEIYGLTNVGTSPSIKPFAIGGDTVANDGTYWYHAFLSTSKFVPLKDITADVLVIAGGGGGGYTFNGGAGGGGAGGVFYKTSLSLTKDVEQIVKIGAGGVQSYNNPTNYGTNGNDSQFGSLTLAKGGGLGGKQYGGSGNGSAGGSGGGGGGSGTTYAGGASTQTGTGGTGYGYAGGAGDASTQNGGGGGGAGAVGGGGYTGGAGAGGAGLNTWSAWASATNTGASGYFAGGGGGNPGASGGAGGGGTGSSSAGTANTGGGGGAGSNQGNGNNGGSGIVIVRYAIV